MKGGRCLRVIEGGKSDVVSAAPVPSRATNLIAAAMPRCREWLTNDLAREPTEDEVRERALDIAAIQFGALGGAA